MSELPPSALTLKPQDGVHQSMCLQLQNNDFLKSSSTSSSSSSSPDSTYSLSSMDVELPEGIMGSKAATSEDDSGIQSPDYRPDDNENSVSVYLDANEEGRYPECDDQENVTTNQNPDNIFSNAAAVDLEQVRRGSGDSSATEAQLFTENEEGEDEDEDSFLSLKSVDVLMKKQSEPERVQMFKKDCVGPVSHLHQEVFQDADDPPEDKGQMSNSAMRTHVGFVSEFHQTFQESLDYPNEVGYMCSSTSRTSVASVNEVHQEAFQDSEDPPEDIGQMHCPNRRLDVESVCLEALQESLEFNSEEIQIQTSAKRHSVDLLSKIYQEYVQTNTDLFTDKSPSHPPAESINQTTSPSVSKAAHPSTTIQNITDTTCCTKRNLPMNANDPLDPSQTRSPVDPPKFKSTKMEVKRYSGPNLKDIKPKVISRASSASRPANPDHSQSQPRSRVANRKEQSHDVFKKRASSTQARTSTPLRISDSDSKPTWLPLDKKQPPDFLGSKMVTNEDHVQTASLMAFETLRDERESHKDELVVKENTRDGDVDQTVSSDLRTTGVVTRVPSRGCVSAGVRAASLTGVPKMKVIDSNTAMSGSSPGWKPPLKSASSKLPIKNGSLPTSLSSSSVASAASENKGVAQVMKSEETCGRPSQGKSSSTKPTAGFRTKANTPVKPNTAGQKATHIIQAKTTQNVLQRGGSVRPSQNSASVCPSSRGPRGTRPVHTHTEKEEEKKNRSILQLRSLVAHGNRRLEALAIVVQQIFNEREEALKQKTGVSIQLKNLREELSQSVVRCEQLECEKASVCAQLDSVVLTLQQQHQAELAQLEERLRDFYSAEWDKAHQVYQEEADRCTALMRQQVEEVKSKQEALRTEQEVAHSRQIEELRQGYETMLAELHKSHKRDRQELDNTHKSSEAALDERIMSLMKENETLSERLRETENKRKALADRSQRDSRVVYLEQELESLMVVLDIKTNQLHQQDKKLMQMDRLIESNVKLEEFVTKLQQENEDYKARMDKHAELSRQLSTEQAMLQQTLQKESKANKRLSMENEELLWKLHNGISPRNSASFPSSPISPR
ncbi:microtubule-associated tumor suppressor 1 homolog [Tachysurus fulvidraco]|uniref:microtubule-associated tumor suppressor 1 homolog n=1 Tax=Tachysurus fulvidraco TaxID=1234273 RepID=UPI001FEF1A9A|nr:microtubule-associated tumor suppressor 1 homolog [Tachysurus fulvidraco]